MTRAASGNVLFIAGWGRSGSTLVDRLLGQLPSVMSVGEMRDIWQRGLLEDRLCGCGLPFSICPFWQRVGEQAFGGWATLDAARVSRLRMAVDRPWNLPFLLFPRLATRTYRRNVREYATLLGQLYDGVASVSGARVTVDSSKIATYALLLRAAGLRLHILHLVRDSRGVIHSWRKQVLRTDATGRPDPDYMRQYGAVAGSLRYLVYNVLTEMLRLGRLPYRRLRYEDVVAAPDAALAVVADHAGVDVEPVLLTRLREGAVKLAANHTVDGNPMRFTAGEVRIRLDDAWRSKLPRPSRWVVSSLTFPLLHHYGYVDFFRRNSRSGGPPFPERTVTDRTGAPPLADRLPSVSVIIPTVNRPELLERAIDSVLGQDYNGLVECIVVYDGSEPALTDCTLGRDRTLRILRNDRTKGTAGARNTGLIAASGDLLAQCDDDDEWMPGKLRTQSAALQRHPAAIGCGGGHLLMHGNRSTVRLPSRAFLAHRDLLRSRIAEIHPSTLVLRRRWVFSEDGLLDEQLPGSYGEDYDWLLRMTHHGHLVTVAQPLARVLWHSGSFFVGQWDTIARAIIYLLDKHTDLAGEPTGLARLYGRLAFANAALGKRSEARHWAMVAMRHNPLERRAYLALAATVGLLSPRIVMRVVNATGRGI